MDLRTQREQIDATMQQERIFAIADSRVWRARADPGVRGRVWGDGVFRGSQNQRDRHSPGAGGVAAESVGDGAGRGLVAGGGGHWRGGWRGAGAYQAGQVAALRIAGGRSI